MKEFCVYIPISKPFYSSFLSVILLSMWRYLFIFASALFEELLTFSVCKIFFRISFDLVTSSRVPIFWKMFQKFTLLYYAKAVFTFFNLACTIKKWNPVMYSFQLSSTILMESLCFIQKIKNLNGLINCSYEVLHTTCNRA